MHVVKTAQERAAQLAKDCHLVRTIIGMADIEARYPKDLHFLHQADACGKRNTTSAMLLLPTGAAEGIKVSSLEESVGLRHGTYQEVPVPTEYINVTKKVALQVKRKMAEEGMMHLSTTTSPNVRYTANKITRAQLGAGLHDVWIRDLCKTCGVQCLFVNDMMHGPGEVMKAAIVAKVSEEANSSGVRVCKVGRAVGPQSGVKVVP